MSGYQCEYCDATFGKSKSFRRHQASPPNACQLVQKKLNDFQQVQHEREQEIIANQKAQYERKFTNVQEKNKELLDALKKRYEAIIEELIHTDARARTRRRVKENKESQLKQIPNFEMVIKHAEIPQKLLERTAKMGVDGDIMLFKKYFTEDIPKDQQCVRIRDYARDKYQYFDGTEWVTTSLTYISTILMDQLWEKYQVVIQKKLKLLDEINKKYLPWVHPEKNQVEFDRVTDEFSSETKHISELLVHDTAIQSMLKMGLRSALHTKT